MIAELRSETRPAARLIWTLPLLSLAAYAALHATVVPAEMADMLVYRAEGAAAAAGGHDLYGLRVTEWDLPATYPPFAALLFVPTTWLGLPALKVAVTLGNAALLALLVHLSLRLANWPAPHARRIAVPAAIALGIWLEPVFQTLHFGQVNLLVTTAVLWDLSRPDGARGKGLAVGLVAGIKLTPAIFAVHLLLTGRTRAGLTAAGAFLATAAVGLALLPSASVEFWTLRLFETGRVGKPWIVDNQSLQGLIARALHTAQPGPVWSAAAVATAAAGLAVAARASRRGDEPWAVVACAVTALLVSPISWSHHWVWCVPLLALLAADAPGIALGATAVFLARTMWLVPHAGVLDLRLPWWQQPLAAPYPLLGLAFLARTAMRAQSEASSSSASTMRYA
ncbi:glycosyltransferase 87 family protein [Wenjunlia tyrosinilytica]|uniref:glycosyltransferase 87 family protein n=1 Tax=Wenjunlia tyrosinilytica TaxID=1544741 RepID=UPI00357127D7